MLSKEKCKKILEQDGQKYSDEQLNEIRQQLYKLANLEYHLFKELKRKRDANSNHLHKSIDWRPSWKGI